MTRIPGRVSVRRAAVTLTCCLGSMLSACSPSKPLVAPSGDPRQALVLSAAARRECHSRNPQDWVGELHNIGVATAVDLLRSGRVRAGHLCEALFRLEVPEAQLPAKARGADMNAVRAVVGRTLAGTKCGSPSGALKPKKARHLATASRVVELSAAASGLLLQIDNALDATDNSTALATELLPVLDAAAELADQDEAEVVAGVAAIAQSSAEYWEANTQSTIQVVGTWVQENCQGLSMEDWLGAGTCQPPDCYETSNPPNSDPALGFCRLHLASSRTSMFCPAVSAWGMAKADGKGAVFGFLWGLVFGPGALVSAGYGAITNSTLFAFEAVLEYYWCLLGWM